jgi:hypothetical protein
MYIMPAIRSSVTAYEVAMVRGPVVTTGISPTIPAVPADTVRKIYYVANNDMAATTIKVRTRVYATGIAPVALKKVAKQVKVGVVKVPKRTAKAMQHRIGR